MNERFDAVILGMGPGGEAVASRLIAAGRRIAIARPLRTVRIRATHVVACCGGLPDGVVGGGVVVADDVSGPPWSQRCPPPCPSRRHEVGHRVVVAAQPCPDLYECLIGVQPRRPRPSKSDGGSRQERQHLAALLVDAEHPRCPLEVVGRKVAQQGVYRRGPRPGRAPHRSLDQHRTTGVAAGQSPLLHGNQPPSDDRPGAPGWQLPWTTRSGIGLRVGRRERPLVKRWPGLEAGHLKVVSAEPSLRWGEGRHAG